MVTLRLNSSVTTAHSKPLGDKSGLGLDVRRKAKFTSQQALILLTDLAHNFLGHFHQQALVGSSFAHFGPQRIVRDLLTIPRRLTFSGTQLKRIELLDTHPYAKELLICLPKLISSAHHPQ